MIALAKRLWITVICLSSGRFTNVPTSSGAARACQRKTTRYSQIIGGVGSLDRTRNGKGKLHLWMAILELNLPEARQA